MNSILLIILGFALTYGNLNYINEDDSSMVLQQNKLKRRISKRYSRSKTNENFTSDEPDKSEFIFQEDSNNVAFVYWKYASEGVIFFLTCESANVSNHNKFVNKGCNSPSNLYRSSNDGKTFTLQNKIFGDAFLHSIYLTPLNKKFKILTDYKNKSIYLTRDNGMSFTRIKTIFAPTFILFHSKFENYLAGYDYTLEGGNSVYISTDSGVTWAKVASDVRNYFWSKNDTKFYIELKDGKQVDEETQSSSLYMCNIPCNSIYKVISEDLVPYSIYVGINFIMVQYLSNQEIYVSFNNNGFEKLVYDKEFIKPHLHHTILNENENEYLLGIIHPDLTISLYLSEPFGYQMQFVQSDIIMENGFKEDLIPKIDFFELGGSFGTYIVNKKNIGTLISFDKGHNWEPIKLNTNDCRVNCEITLYIKVEQATMEFTAPLISKESAPGVIIAQGFLTKKQVNEKNPETHKIFVSFDGGHSWKEHLDSLYGYAILDHGGLIAATPLTYTIDNGLSYTIDYGNTWQVVSISKRYSRIAAIITESSGKSLQLNIFGFLHEQPFLSAKKVNTWVVWQFDFTKLFTGICKPDDYITWKHNDKCVLGRNITSKRRSAHKNCLNGVTFENNITITPCECSLEDFKCDKYYFKNETNFCLPYSNKHILDASDCKVSYLKTKGYVKMFGDLCNAGLEKELMPSFEPCPVLPPKIVKISASNNPQTVLTNITFRIDQVYGFFNTMYSWNFGDGSKSLFGTFNEMKLVQHAFKTAGNYLVKMTASNIEENVTFTINVEVVKDFLLNADIIYDPPIIVNIPTEFKLGTYDKNGTWNALDMKNANFIWSFNDKYTKGLTSIKTYNFPTPGTYKVEVQIITPYSYQLRVKNVPVFKSTTAIDFVIETAKDHSIDEELFVKLKEFLVVMSGIFDDSRIIINADHMSEKKVRVFFCDYGDSPKNNAKSIAQQLNAKINYLKPLIFNGARIIQATLVTYSELKIVEKLNKNHWVSVVIPLLIMVIAISVIVFLYRNKIRRIFFKQYDHMKNVLVLDMEGEEFVSGERIY